jgi:predicted glycogen debranching enzyme
MREWIVTNSLGGYASLNYQNTNTRKYHGLLIASLNPPTERWIFVTNVYDVVKINNKVYNLKDEKNSFNFDFFPNFFYNIENLKIIKTIFMEYGKNTTIIKYNIKTKKPIKITHYPIVNSRHIYDVNRHRHLTFQTELHHPKIIIKPSNIDKTLKIILEDFSYEPTCYWEELFYEKDRERNDAWIDNNINLGKFQKTINKSTEYYLVLTIEDEVKQSPSEIYTNVINRKRELINIAKLPKSFEKLVLSSDNFIVKKEEHKSVIAGYHWFGDWGRDTLIALPGLTLVTHRFDDAKKILRSLSKYCKNGLIPNAFMDRNSKPVYNTVDASLWYIDRVYQYLKYTNDREFLIEIWNKLQSIINCYKTGTEFGIYMDKDYLISHDPGLTWMDIKIGDYYPTPRDRKAVEIQGLWYNALRIMSNLSKILGEKDPYFILSEKVKENFNYKYDQQYDVIDIKDLSFRPNQIFLVSLDFTMISKTLQNKIVKDVYEKLFTIFGLRSLAPMDPRYKGKYLGDYNKDIAYHNGTVWPWLIGPFIQAFIKVNNYEDHYRKVAYEQFLKPMINVFGEKWDGSIYEIFDGDPIYEPHGCITQAWSVSEILRTWIEDIENKKPEFEKSFISHEIRV